MDKPLALWVEAKHLPEIDRWLRFLTDIKTPIFTGVLLIYIICVSRAYLFTRLTKRDRDALFIGNSVIFSYLLQNKLHEVFGRYWPMTWVAHNPSLIGEGDYGFHFFHSGNAFQSFPSGHTTVCRCVMCGNLGALSQIKNSFCSRHMCYRYWIGRDGLSFLRRLCCRRFHRADYSQYFGLFENITLS